MRILIIFIIVYWSSFSFGIEKDAPDSSLLNRAEGGDAATQLELSQFYYDKANIFLKESVKYSS
ncbi:MAG: hypothetical protein OXM55_00665 [Bdellovibrionales bacterium]|nr:hypothetical protein [Bdellovibrionales bacterium]